MYRIRFHIYFLRTTDGVLAHCDIGHYLLIQKLPHCHVAPGRGQGVESLPIILILSGDVFNLIGSSVPHFLVIISGAWLYPWAGRSQGTF
jgi:hypothetical protein